MKALKSLTFFIILFGCSYFTNPLKKAKKALSQGDCKKTREFLLQSLKIDTSFALKALDFCKNKASAKWFYIYLSEHEKDKRKQVFYKEELARYYFEKEENYEKAIETWFSLKNNFFNNKAPLAAAQSASGKIYKNFIFLKVKPIQYSYNIALAFFEIKKWESALLEIKKEGVKDPDFLLKEFESLYKVKDFEDELKQTGLKFYLDFLFLKARVLLLQKKYKESEKEFLRIQQVNIEFFESRNIHLYLSFIYEISKNFDKAVEELKGFKNTSDFLKNKIERLKTRQRNLPAKGS